MKVNLIKFSGGVFAPADEESVEQLKKVNNNEVYTADIKLNQNYKLLQKVHVFFKFCAQHYYGDINVTAEQVKLTRDKITMSAGYAKKVFLPDGLRFEVYPMSISYDKMSNDERGDFYNAIVNSALKNVFHTADENTLNQLMGFF